MDLARWRRLKRIFREARDKPESDRSGFLEEVCEGDLELRTRVEALLAADLRAEELFSSPTAGEATVPEHTGATELFDRLQRAVSGRYSLERELGRGGMGIVYLARDVALDRPIALKLLPPVLATRPDHRERFLREARTAAGLSHPNIVPIHLVEEKDGLVYFVMAFADGESLGDRVRRAGPLETAEAARLVQEVAWALAYAHGRGVIHRDVKPDNILIDKGSGRALVTDFGIARMTRAGTVSQQGEVLGTLRYMSPEQASPEAVIDGRSDIYSLGVTAFFALTGRLPFESDHPAALVAMHAAQPAPPLRSLRSGVPARLAEAVDRCLAKDPDDRFPSGEALAEAIADARVTLPEMAPSVREFLQAARGGLAQLALLFFLWLFAATTGGVPAVVYAFLMVLLPFVLFVPLHNARGVVRAGLDEQDVAAAAASSGSAWDPNVEYELAHARRTGELLSTIWARGALLLLGAALVGSLLPSVLRDGDDVVAFVWSSAVAAALVAVAIAPKRILNTVSRGTPEYAGFFRKLWAGPLGRWLFGLAGLGLERPKPLPTPASAPTAMVLGRAADELFDQLPKDLRTRLGDVHDVIGGLERVARGLRIRRDELDRAVADAGPLGSFARRGALVSELEAAREAVDGRLASAVSALEDLRLDLLRLRAGVGSPDDLTASIEEARSVSRSIDFELAARREVDSLAR